MTWFEQTFTAPGTWTNVDNVSTVEVIVVGGGGGGSPTQAGAGGGGGVFWGFLPVSGPVPVTVGAGGTVGSAGGTSIFNPAPTGISVGGGGAAGSNAPPTGGGGGSGNTLGGTYGVGSGYPESGGGARGSGGRMGGGQGLSRYGGGAGHRSGGAGAGSTSYLTTNPMTPAIANTGGGGVRDQAGASGVVIVRWFYG